jgi:2-methylisocitrate lyase-like PEP mutase family enzyme
MTIRTLGTEVDADRVQYSSEMMSLSIDDLYELGYQMYIEPTTLLGVAANAMVDAARKVRESGYSTAVAAEHGNLYDHLERWMDVADVRRVRSAYVERTGQAASERSEADAGVPVRVGRP